MAVNEATLKRMGVFLSNFTELLILEIDSPAAMSREDLVRFGIRHNDINNFRSRVQQKEDQPGDLIIDGKWVAESVKKYFDLDLEHGSVMYSDSPDSPYYYDGKFYHYFGAAGEAAYHARVREAYKLPDGNIRMTGELYDPDSGAPDSNSDTRPFEAVARPYKFGGKDTWSIVSLSTKTE